MNAKTLGLQMQYNGWIAVFLDYLETKEREETAFSTMIARRTRRLECPVARQAFSIYTLGMAGALAGIVFLAQPQSRGVTIPRLASTKRRS